MARQIAIADTDKLTFQAGLLEADQQSVIVADPVGLVELARGWPLKRTRQLILDRLAAARASS